MLSFLYHVLNPTLLHIAVQSLVLVYIHSLHSFYYSLLVLLVLLLETLSTLSTLLAAALALLRGWDVQLLLALLRPFITLVLWVRVVLLLWILWVAFVVSVHHYLEELALRGVLLVLEDYLANEDECFLCYKRNILNLWGSFWWGSEESSNLDFSDMADLRFSSRSVYLRRDWWFFIFLDWQFWLF